MSGIRDRLLYFGIEAFRMVPLSIAQRRRVRDVVFAVGGPLFSELQSYRDWKASRVYEREDEAAMPAIRAAREAIFGEHYRDSATAPAFLFISHDLGGGTETHLQDLGAMLERRGVRVLVLRTARGSRVRLSPFQDIPERRLVFDWRMERDALMAVLRALKVAHVHVHHTIDLPGGFVRDLPGFAQALGVAYDFTAHDYFSICPRFTLYDEGVRGYCGEPVAVKCTACVKTYGSAAGPDVDVPSWRTEFEAFFNGARRVFVPDEDARSRLQRYFPKAAVTLRPHPEHDAAITPLAATRREGEILKVAIIGAIAPHKGSHVIEACARDALARQLPISFTVIGFTDIDWRLKRLANVRVTGRFKEGELTEWLKEHGGYHLAFFPAVWPETYNYTLSEALRHGLFPMCFDIGAIARRVRALGWGVVLPLPMYQHPAAINDALLAARVSAAPVARIAASFVRYDDCLRDYYELELAQNGAAHSLTHVANSARRAVLSP